MRNVLKSVFSKKVSAAVLTAVMLFVSVFSMSMIASAASFSPRLSAPSLSNKYYYSDLNAFYKYGYGMPNCTAYAYANMHEEFMKGKITIIGCPKLDDVDYTEKLQQIIANNDIQSVTVVRMEVPCCGGLEHAAVTALRNSGKFIPWQVVTISVDGKILD